METASQCHELNATSVEEPHSSLLGNTPVHHYLVSVDETQPKMAKEPLVDWDSGLLDCFEDASTCCYGFWCGPCLACTVSGRLGENNCLPLCDIFCSTCLHGIPIPPAALSVRVAMRNRYGIKGSICKDIFISWCCTWCSWCQMHRELKHRKKSPTVINTQHNTIINMQPIPVAQTPVMMIPAQPAVAVISQ